MVGYILRADEIASMGADDLREFIEGLAEAMGWLACADIDADRIANTAPLF